MKKIALCNSFFASIISFRALSLCVQIGIYLAVPPIDGDPSTYWIYERIGVAMKYLGNPISIFMAVVIGCLALHFLVKCGAYMNWFMFAIFVIIVFIPFRIKTCDNSTEFMSDRHNNGESTIEIIREIKTEFPAQAPSTQSNSRDKAK